MSLDLVQQALGRQIAIDAQIADHEMRGRKVALHRDLYDGDHPSNMTREMRKTLRMAQGEEFHNNHLQNIIDTENDRIVLDRIEADNAAATKWAQQLYDDNRLDGMQGDVHGSTLLDADSFVMVSWDNEEKRIVLTHELAFDGNCGMFAVYRSANTNVMDAAVKIWHIQSENGSVVDTIRINVYYPDRVRKLISEDGTGLRPYKDEYTDEQGYAAWTERDDRTPLGIPVIHFKNRGRQNYGISEIENARPLQLASNRNLHSMIMSGELTAFQIRIARGFQPPAEVTPGMWVNISPEAPLENGETADADVLEQGDLTQFIAVADYLEQQMYKVTNTPHPSVNGSDNASGESLKQKDIRLIGKVKRFEVKAGNAWEDVFKTAHKVQTAFGDDQPPSYERFYARWADPEIRNDQITIDNALKLKDAIGDREFLRIVAPIYGWDESKIDQILAEKRADNAKRLDSLAGSLPDFGDFNLPNDATGAAPTSAGQEVAA